LQDAGRFFKTTSVLRDKSVHLATETVDFAFFRDRLAHLATEQASFVVLRIKLVHSATDTVDFAFLRDRIPHLATEKTSSAPPSCSWIITSAEPQSIAKVIRTGDNITIIFNTFDNKRTISE